MLWVLEDGLNTKQESLATLTALHQNQRTNNKLNLTANEDMHAWLCKHKECGCLMECLVLICPLNWPGRSSAALDPTAKA